MLDLEFLVYVLDKFNKFNATFQNNKPLLHELQDYVSHLILDLSRSFMDGGYVNNFKSSLLTIDPRNNDKFLPMTSIHVGKGNLPTFIIAYIFLYCRLWRTKDSERPSKKKVFYGLFQKKKGWAEKKTKKFALISNLIPVPEIILNQVIPFVKTTIRFFNLLLTKNLKGLSTQSIIMFISVRNFYAKAVAELKTRFNFDDNVYKLLPMIKPKSARQLSPQSLWSLFIRYPVLRDHVNEDDAESEWRSHVSLSDDYFNVSADDGHEYHNMDTEFHWNRVFAAKSPSGEPRFPNLKVCVSLLLTLPFSNVAAERFSATWKTQNPQRKMVYTTNQSMEGKMWLKKPGKGWFCKNSRFSVKTFKKCESQCCRWKFEWLWIANIKQSLTLSILWSNLIVSLNLLIFLVWSVYINSEVISNSSKDNTSFEYRKSAMNVFNISPISFRLFLGLFSEGNLAIIGHFWQHRRLNGKFRSGSTELNADQKLEI